jgi:rfaE bifunctional protein kinase chain/domain
MFLAHILLNKAHGGALMKTAKKIMVTGNFNVLHPGHIRLLKFAKTFGGKLSVGVFSDRIAESAVDSPQEERLEALSSINMVDECLLIDTSLDEFIEAHKPDIVVKGKEFETLDNPEEVALKSYGGQLIFSSGNLGATGEPCNKDQSEISQSARNFINKFVKRHNIFVPDILNLVERFSEKKVCVIGDTIIDEYVDCFPLGMSQEEPTLVVTPQETKRYLGGAGIVASHASQLGAGVHLLSVAGNDPARDFAASVLGNYGVNYRFLVDASRPTTLKQRFRSGGRSLLRVSTLSQQAISLQQQEKLYNEFEKISNSIDVLIFSDFNYGSLPQKLVSKITMLAKKNNVFIAADSQSSSQTGDIGRFAGVDLLTPTEREARISLRNNDDGLVVLANRLIEKTGSKNVILKMGGDGMLIHSMQAKGIHPQTETLQALNQNPVDVSGAGDSLLVVASLAMSIGAPLSTAALLGNIAAFVQVGRIGNKPLTVPELKQVIAI